MADPNLGGVYYSINGLEPLSNESFCKHIERSRFEASELDFEQSSALLTVKGVRYDAKGWCHACGALLVANDEKAEELWLTPGC